MDIHDIIMNVWNNNRYVACPLIKDQEINTAPIYAKPKTGASLEQNYIRRAQYEA